MRHICQCKHGNHNKGDHGDVAKCGNQVNKYYQGNHGSDGKYDNHNKCGKCTVFQNTQEFLHAFFITHLKA